MEVIRVALSIRYAKTGDEKGSTDIKASLSKYPSPVSNRDIWRNNQDNRPMSGFKNDKEMCQLMGEDVGRCKVSKGYLLRD